MLKAFLQRRNTLPVCVAGVFLLCAFFVAFLLPDTTSNAQVRTADEGDASPTPTATPTPTCTPSVMVSGYTCPTIIVKTAATGNAAICVNDTETIDVNFDQTVGSETLHDFNDCPNSKDSTFPLSYPLNVTWIVTESSTGNGVDGTSAQVASGTGNECVYQPTEPGYYSVDFTCTGTVSGGTSDADAFTCNGLLDSSFSFIAYQVDLKPVNLSTTYTLLDPGKICLNVQDGYKYATWQAIVKPEGTASVVVKSGGVSLQADTSILHDGDTFLLEGTQTGNYTLTITHSVAGCPTDEGSVVFQFTDKAISMTHNPQALNDGIEQVSYQQIDDENFTVDFGGTITAGDTKHRKANAPCTVTYKYNIVTVPDGAYTGQVHASSYVDCDIDGSLTAWGYPTCSSSMSYNGVLSASGMVDPPKNDIPTRDSSLTLPALVYAPRGNIPVKQNLKNYIDDTTFNVGDTVTISYQSALIGTTQNFPASFNGTVEADGFDPQIYNYHLETAK